jgi:hypothetical protein
MGVNYGWERFYLALRSAVTSTEPLQVRLESIMTGGTGVGWLTRDHFPSDEMWRRFESLMNETKGRAQLTDEEAGRLLKECFDLFDGLAASRQRDRG